MIQGTTELILGIFVVHMSSRELQAIYLQYSCFENTMIFESFLMLLKGEVSEWFKEHAWKVRVSSQVPWVRIPLSPANFYLIKPNCLSKIRKALKKK